jgi:hypothetical protein
MATTSSNLTAGAAITAQGGNGQGGKRRAVGLVATAALGLSLLAGVAFGSGPAAATRRADSSAGTAVTRPQVWGGACRAGGGVCIPDEDFAAQPQVAAADTALKLPELRDLTIRA